MRKLLLVLLSVMAFNFVSAQTFSADSSRRAKKDSTLRAAIHADSLKIEKEFAENEKWEKMYATAAYPLVKETKSAGVIPVKDLTELPDPNMEYKLLFELITQNPDSLRSEMDMGLEEVSRIINLHVANGIPAKKIIPVIVVHGSALSVVSNNEYFKNRFKKENPSIKLFNELKSVGAKFIICGQAMTMFDMKKEDFLPDVKLALTAQTVLSSYQLKNFVLYTMEMK